MESEAKEEKKGLDETQPEPRDGSEDTHPLVAENTQLKQDLLYQKAEFENYKKRMLRDQDQAIRFANEKVFRDLITVVDLLDRGISHGKALHSKPNAGHEELRTLLSGVEMTSKELAQLLSRFGVEFIGVSGEKFDPSKHEAISEVETADEKVGHVIEVLQRGSSLHGRLLAPARVVVGKAKH